MAAIQALCATLVSATAYLAFMVGEYATGCRVFTAPEDGFHTGLNFSLRLRNGRVEGRGCAVAKQENASHNTNSGRGAEGVCQATPPKPRAPRTSAMPGRHLGTAIRLERGQTSEELAIHRRQ